MERPPTPSYLETVAETAMVAGAAPAPAVDSSISQLTSTPVAEEGRFLPGALLGGRYRIIGLLGRGGMGEVYRATDLALGQAVALKFLPPEAAGNPRLLERFHGEVRVARLVSHPNVCRVFDIGEVEGTPFISMEYVDGEDLATLLTRIGRLPADKALETARKLCAGLAAAHDRGVIHRDLKPQNIMMNKRGDVVIMDFGLAAIADQISGAEVRNGTPAYMAPEQLKADAVTHRSDIYALGLVLYELFTGKRPYEAKSLQQLIDLQESAHLTSMTSVAADIDPAVEKVIRRCLDPDPLRRPNSALSVAAALPGGDPLAAALAAGETPSPELVASAGKVEGLARRYSIPCLVVVVACIFSTTWFYGRSRAIMRAPLENPPEVLAHQARDIAASFGYTARPVDSTVWLEHRGGLVDYLNKKPAPRNWDAWLAAEAPIRAIYRESPQPLLAWPKGMVDGENPPPTVPGMAMVAVDGHGKLLTFSAVPGGTAPATPVGPEAIFRAAGLPMEAFHEVPPSFTPAHASDSVRAWKGLHPRLPGTELTVEAAFWKGKVTQVTVGYPYTVPDAPTQESWFNRIRDVMVLAFPVCGSLLMALVARRNWKLGRTDRRGALALAGVRFALGLGMWAGLMHAVPAGSMLKMLESEGAELLGSALVLWVLYLALEPAVRARYPHSIVTWNRLLAGRWLDAQLGSDILIGAATGCLIWVGYVFVADFGPRDIIELGGNLPSMLGTRPWLGRQIGALGEALSLGVLVFAVICGLRRLVRYDIAAAVVTAVIFTVAEEDVTSMPNWKVVAVLFVLLYTALAMVLMRFGLVATVSAIFYVNLFSAISVGTDWTRWYVPAGLATMTLMLGVAGFAFWRSLGSRDLLGGEESA